MPIKQRNERGSVDQPCGEFADRLVDLSDGELPAAEVAAVREHVAECPACRLTLVRLDRSRAVLVDALVSTRPPTASGSAVPTAGAVSPMSTVRRGWPLALATCVAVAALVLLAWGLNRGPDGSGPTRGDSPPLVHAAPEEILPMARETPEIIARRLALIEQVARLEASLAMLPDDPWFTSQRTANERLLATFRQAVEELDSPANSSDRNLSTRNDVL